eukprot:363926-Chlamydomonas_euryale.AAC.6
MQPVHTTPHLEPGGEVLEDAWASPGDDGMVLFHLEVGGHLGEKLGLHVAQRGASTRAQLLSACLAHTRTEIGRWLDAHAHRQVERLLDPNLHRNWTPARRARPQAD